jgi:AraC-like DNA-binding protein
MEELYKISNVGDYNELMQYPTLHPLVSVVDFSKCPLLPAQRYLYGVYAIFLKEVKCGDIRYGKQTYDYQEGTLVFIAPGQVVGFERTPEQTEQIQPKGWGLVFSRELLSRTPLAHTIDNYSFFSYNSNEALHMSEQEKALIAGCFGNIDEELHGRLDTHSRSLIVSNIALILNYSRRFYDRQFVTRKEVNKDLLVNLETLVNDYFESEMPKEKGLPTVSYFADQLHLSSNYFGDLMRKETGISPQRYIQDKLIDIAKTRVLDTSKTLMEVSYELGFDYSQHFSRWFKNSIGCTPRDYRRKA